MHFEINTAHSRTGFVPRSCLPATTEVGVKHREPSLFILITVASEETMFDVE